MSTVTVEEETVRANPNPPCQHFLWEETEISGENKRLSTERWRTVLCHETKRMISEVKGACSDNPNLHSQQYTHM
jgi:hypothetical protein